MTPFGLPVGEPVGAGEFVVVKNDPWLLVIDGGVVDVLGGVMLLSL